MKKKKKKRQKRKNTEAVALRRAEIIMKVRTGMMTATEAARRLGVSRKTYYKWEQRGLAALVGGLQDQSPGRPEDEEINERETELERLLREQKEKNELLLRKMELKDLLHQFDLASAENDRDKKK